MGGSARKPTWGRVEASTNSYWPRKASLSPIEMSRKKKHALYGTECRGVLPTARWGNTGNNLISTEEKACKRFYQRKGKIKRSRPAWEDVLHLLELRPAGKVTPPKNRGWQKWQKGRGPSRGHTGRSGKELTRTGMVLLRKKGRVEGGQGRGKQAELGIGPIRGNN